MQLLGTQVRTNPNYLLTLAVFVTCISGNDGLVSLSGDLFYPFFTLLLHLFHLVDTLVPGEGKRKDVWVYQALPAGPRTHMHTHTRTAAVPGLTPQEECLSPNCDGCSSLHSSLGSFLQTAEV